MSNITNFLERLGSDARMRTANRQDLDGMLETFGLSAAERSAIAAKDRTELERLAGVNTKTCCLIELVEEEVE